MIEGPYHYKVLDEVMNALYDSSCFRNVEDKPLMKTKMLFATLLTLALLTAGYAQTLDKAKLDQLFDRLLEKNKGMGSLALAKDGNVLYSRSFGYRQINGNEKKPLTAETKYRIASITKTFTAVMIFQLVEEEKLKLTDTLDKFFPQIPNAARITIGQILTHRSGIHDLEADGSWGSNREQRTKWSPVSLKASLILSRTPGIGTATRAMSCWVTSSKKQGANRIRKP